MSSSVHSRLIERAASLFLSVREFLLSATPGKHATFLGVNVALLLVAIVILWRRIKATLSAIVRKPPKALPEDAKTAVSLPLTKIVQLSEDSRLFRFDLPTEKHVFGLPTGAHVMVAFGNDQRPYTPVSSDALDKGYVDFVIKVYFPNKEFPKGGVVSQKMEGLKIGDECAFYGPLGGKRYVGKGQFTVKRLKSQGGGAEMRRTTSIGMIAGGSGITPMLQIMREMLRESGERGPKISLLYANKSEEDILCRSTLENFEKNFPGRVKVWYTVDKLANAKNKETWKYDVGFITSEMIEKHLPKPGKETQILVCGPPPMMKFAVNPAFEKLSYDKSMYLTW